MNNFDEKEKKFHLTTITTDGIILHSILKKELSLKEMQALVGGLIQIVQVRIGSKEFDMYCNEEGLLLELPFNEIATHLFQETYNWYESFIVGTVFFYTNEPIFSKSSIAKHLLKVTT